VTYVCGATYLKPGFLTARRAKKQCGTIWQHRYMEHCVRDDADYEKHMDYLHWNPVKHELVKRVAD
jgi:putative transposase